MKQNIFLTGIATFPDICYKDLPNINLVNVTKHTNRLDKSEEQSAKSLLLYISYRGELVSVGRVGGKIVLVAYTPYDSKLSNRRIFDTMTHGVYFRSVDKSSDSLKRSKLHIPDVAKMASIFITGFERGEVVQSGLLRLDFGSYNAGGKAFADAIVRLVERYDYEHEINSNQTLERIERSLKHIEMLNGNRMLDDETKREQAHKFAAEWLGRDELCLSKRPKIRECYAEIKMHALLRPAK